jgi:hypothetical protein
MYVVTVWVKRRSGRVSPMRSNPMSEAAADSLAFALRATGYRVVVRRAEVER